MRYSTIGLILLAFGVWSCNEKRDDATVSNSNSEAVELNNETKNLYANLKQTVANDQFIFGQQRATLVGVGEKGDSVWSDGAFGTTSDTKLLVGQDVGLLGLDVWDFAMKNPTWNQDVYPEAIKSFYNEGRGGAITFEWHMRGCSVEPQRDANGNVGIPGGGFKVDDWQADSNASCLCRIANDETWYDDKTWLDWLQEEKLDKFYDQLVDQDLTEVPLIFRPFHEHTGNWFWWGSKSWNCKRHLGRDDVVTGPEAYKKIFRMTVDYLRETKGLKNLLIAYSPDKLCKHEGHTCDIMRSIEDNPNAEELRADYLNAYPGDEYVDILGIDLYYQQDFGNPWEKAEYQTTLNEKYLRVVTKLAEEKDKVAALTETGNYNLHQEANQEASEGRNWYTDHLLAMLKQDDINLAYVLTWENRKINDTEYYIPHKDHQGFSDFQTFADDEMSLFFDDLPAMYQAPEGVDQAANVDSPDQSNGAQSAEPLAETSDQSTTGEESFGYCSTVTNDPDGDGWGYENGQSCRIPRLCEKWDADPDGDGWGYEYGDTCKMPAQCPNAANDPDGDGWGYENGQACRTAPRCQDATDPDGDGWGYENGQSCRTHRPCRDGSTDPDGDGWGFENGQSCRVY